MKTLLALCVLTSTILPYSKANAGDNIGVADPGGERNTGNGKDFFGGLFQAFQNLLKPPGQWDGKKREEKQEDEQFYQTGNGHQGQQEEAQPEENRKRYRPRKPPRKPKLPKSKQSRGHVESISASSSSESTEVKPKPAATKREPKGRSFTINEDVPLTPESEVDTTISSPACDAKSKEMTGKIVELRKLLDAKIPETSLVYNYSRGNNYLLRWLIGCAQEVAKCEKTIVEVHMPWRQSNGLHKIEEGNWESVEKSFPLFYTAKDKAGRPVVEMWLKEWNMNEGVSLQGVGIRMLIKWFIKMLELVTRQMYELNVKKQRCTTQAIMLVDVENINEKMHTCQQCLKAFAVMAATYEVHYPNLFKEIHFTNTGATKNPAFVNVLKAMVGAFQDRDRYLSSFHFYTDKTQWEPKFAEIINKDQRSQRFGGTKKYP